MEAQKTMTPVQEIIREHHHHHQPVYIPVPSAPISQEVRHTGKSVHEIFIRHEPVQLKPPDEIPIEYFGGQPPPQPPKDGNRVKKTFVPSKLKKERLTPYSGGQPPNVPGGATAPMPIPEKTEPIKQEYIPKKPEKLEPELVRPPKRKAIDQDRAKDLKPFGEKHNSKPGFKGQGFIAGETLDFSNKPKRDPFGGQSHRLDDNVIDQAKIRMSEIAKKAAQQTTKKQNFDGLIEVEKKKRRGGGMGDVVSLGKRKTVDPDVPAILRRTKSQTIHKKQKLYDKDTELFNIGD
jgi:hypothetical protein